MTTANILSQLGSPGVSTGFKNRIINGGMVIDQRNAGASVTINASAVTYTLDRWFGFGQATDGVFTVQQAGTGLAGLPQGLKVTVTTADASIGATQSYLIGQYIEGFNTADLAFGTASAKTVTLSFWIYSSITGTLSGSLRNSAANRSYPFTYTVNSANTWEQKSITIPGDTTGTWVGSTNGIGLAVIFSLGGGSTVSGTAGSWSASNFTNATGAVNPISTLNATIYFTGVQLEVGTTATNFDYRSIGQELALCQRYYYRLKAGTAYANAGTGRAYSTTNCQCVVAMPVSMRAAPTSTGYSALTDWNAAQASGNITAMSPAAQYSLDYRQMTIDITSTFVSGGCQILNANNTTNAWIEWSAEL